MVKENLIHKSWLFPPGCARFTPVRRPGKQRHRRWGWSGALARRHRRSTALSPGHVCEFCLFEQVTWFFGPCVPHLWCAENTDFTEVVRWNAPCKSAASFCYWPQDHYFLRASSYNCSYGHMWGIWARYPGSSKIWGVFAGSVLWRPVTLVRVIMCKRMFFTKSPERQQAHFFSTLEKLWDTNVCLHASSFRNENFHILCVWSH